VVTVVAVVTVVTAMAAVVPAAAAAMVMTAAATAVVTAAATATMRAGFSDGRDERGKADHGSSGESEKGAFHWSSPCVSCWLGVVSCGSV
jgi:hypothetical protein